jgi:hypothetical protein
MFQPLSPSPTHLGLGEFLQPLLFLAVRLFTPSTLLEPWLVLCDGGLELTMGEPPAVGGVAELLGGLEIAESDGENAILFLVVECDVGDRAMLFSFAAEVLLDVEVGSLIFVELLQSKGLLDDYDFGPLVLLGSESLGNLFLVVGPLGELAVRSLVNPFSTVRFG